MEKNNDRESKKGLSTISVHSGQEFAQANHSLTTPIFQTSTYTFNNSAELCSFFEGNLDRVAEYGRYGNPTQAVLQDKLKAIEGAEAALMFGSGMAAITTAIFAMVKNGDHIVITSDSYRRTRQFVRQVLVKFGVEHTVAEPNAPAVSEAIRPNTKLIITETPTNPYLRVPDLEKIVDVAKENKIKTMIDSTLATPYNLRPLDLGVDIVTHSATKYFSGHNDVLAGVLLGKEYIIDAIRELLSITGGVSDPNSCYLILRGLKTFALRMEKQNESTLNIARFLEKHPKVERVWYPGLESHPDYELARKLMKGFGGVVSFQIKGGLNEGMKVVDSVEIPKIAPSLGGVETLIEQPSLMSYYELTTQEREAVGIYDNLIRMSVGIEDTEDIIQDLDQALQKI